MKGYRFYEELENKGRKAEQSKGTIVAVLWENYQVELDGYNEYYAQYDAVAGILDEPNSEAGSVVVPDRWLRENCKRVSERRAREIHPQLFAYLDREG